MTDGLTDADDLDLAAVARDDAAIEALRAAARRGGSTGLSFDDPALDLLAALVDDLGDVADAGPLADAGAGTGTGATVLPLVAPSRRTRTLRRGAVATTAAALGVLSIAGVAAAQPGSPLRSVRDVVTEVFHSVTPGDSASSGDRGDALPAASASPTSPTAVPSVGSTRGAGAPVPAGEASRRPSPGVPAERRRAMDVRDQLNAAYRAYEDGRYADAAGHLDRAEALLEAGPATGSAGLRKDLGRLRAAVDAKLRDGTRSPAAATVPARASASPSPSPSRSRTPVASPSADGNSDDGDEDDQPEPGKPTKTAKPSKTAQPSKSPKPTKSPKPPKAAYPSPSWSPTPTRSLWASAAPDHDDHRGPARGGPAAPGADGED